MSQLYNIVQAHFAVENVGTTQQREDLIKLINERYESSNTTMIGTNEGCWRSSQDLGDIEWLKKEVFKLVEQMVGFYIKQDPTYEIKVNMYQGIDLQYWVNVNLPGSKNEIHNHLSDNYVACYYLQAEGTGALTFYNPGNLANEYNQFSPFTSKLSYEPKDGDLVVWPAWVPHEVEENKSDKNRINIPINIRFKVQTEESK